MPTRLLFSLTALLIALSFAGCWEGISRHVLATVLAVRGEVTARPNERAKFEAITLESLFGGGTVIRTSADGQVDLMLVPGVLVRLFDNSELRIQDLILVKDGNETAGGMISRTARMRLTRGRAVAYFLEAEDARGDLIIETDRVSLAAHPGTLFRVEASSDSTRAVSGVGQIYPTVGEAGSLPKNKSSPSPIENAGAALSKGLFQVWPSSAGQPVPAAEDSQAQTELTETIKAGEELRHEREENLPKANRFPRGDARR